MFLVYSGLPGYELLLIFCCYSTFWILVTGTKDAKRDMRNIKSPDEFIASVKSKMASLS